MEITLPIVLFIVITSILIEGFFSASEIALLSADRMILKARANQGSVFARIALRLSQNPDKFLSTTLVLTNVAITLTTTTIALYLQRYPELPSWLGVILSGGIIVVFGELLPKSLGRRFCNRFSPIAALPVLCGYYLLFPFSKSVSWYSLKLGKILRPVQELLGVHSESTREELVSLLRHGTRQTDLSSSERQTIRRILEFQSTVVRHALVPLVRVEAIALEASVKAALERFRAHRHSRMPVYQGRVDNIVGLLEVNSLFRSRRGEESIESYVTKASYVAETTPLERIIEQMRLHHSELVVAVDEHGGATGILTFEDVVEEIVGEIQDEHDEVDSAEFKELGADHWIVRASSEIFRLNEVLRLDIPEGEYETLSGFLLEQFAEIPEIGDELFYDTPTASLHFTIRKATDRQIIFVNIRIIERKQDLL